MVESILLTSAVLSDSLLTGAVTPLGGHAVQHSHWNVFDLTTKAGTDKLKEDLIEKKAASCVDDSSLYHTTFTTIPIKIKVSSSTNEHLGVFLWLVKQD